MGVCCVVFDIDGMLFEFVMIFFYNVLFMFSSRCMLFPTFKNKSGRGGVNVFFLISYFRVIYKNFPVGLLEMPIQKQIGALDPT